MAAYRRIRCDCGDEGCPAWGSCTMLPTEMYPDPDGQVSLLFVGQGGGRQEKRRGRPFCGPAGRRIRSQMVWVRGKVGRYVGVAFSNTIRDCPEGNRVPTDEELAHCRPLLERDIAYLRTRGLRAVVPLGNAAKRALIKDSRAAISADRGSLYYVRMGGGLGLVPMVPTYHPSGLLRGGVPWNPSNLHRKDAEVVGDIMRALEVEAP